MRSGDRWAEVRTDERGRELRMGERRKPSGPTRPAPRCASSTAGRPYGRKVRTPMLRDARQRVERWHRGRPTTARERRLPWRRRGHRRDPQRTPAPRRSRARASGPALGRSRVGGRLGPRPRRRPVRRCPSGHVARRPERSLRRVTFRERPYAVRLSRPTPCLDGGDHGWSEPQRAAPAAFGHRSSDTGGRAAERCPTPDRSAFRRLPCRRGSCGDSGRRRRWCGLPTSTGGRARDHGDDARSERVRVRAAGTLATTTAGSGSRAAADGRRPRLDFDGNDDRWR